MTPLLALACAEPEVALDALEEAPPLPVRCAGTVLAPLPQPTTIRGPGGWAAAPGQVVRPDGSMVPVAGVPVDLDAEGDRAIVALGWAGLAEVDADGVRDLGVAGEIAAVDATPDRTWVADARGRVIALPGGALELAGWPVDVAADGTGAWVALGYGGVVHVAPDPLAVDARADLPHGRARAVAVTPRGPAFAVDQRVQLGDAAAELPAAIGGLAWDGVRLRIEAGGATYAWDGGAPRLLEERPPDPRPPPLPAPRAEVGPRGRLVLVGPEGPGWSVDPGLATPADRALLVGDRVVAGHARDGSLTIARDGRVDRRVHLDGAIGEVLRPGRDGTVWIPLPGAGAARLDPATGETATWRFTPGAVDVLDGDEVLAARGAFGIAVLRPDGTVEACHPGQPVDELRRDGDTVLARTGAAWQPLRW